MTLRVASYPLRQTPKRLVVLLFELLTYVGLS